MYKIKNIIKFILGNNRILMKIDDSDLITNNKLQKLLFYMQGCYLAVFDKPLFKNDFIKGAYGPIIPKIYKKYSYFGLNGINEDKDYSLKQYYLEPEAEYLLNLIFNHFNQYSAYGLKELINNEKIYKETEKNQIISKKAIKKYFKKNYIELINSLIPYEEIFNGIPIENPRRNKDGYLIFEDD